jgi:hypothetical protein
MDMKKCSKCKEDKVLDKFSRNPSSKDGLHSVCKPCRSKTKKIWYENTRDERVEYNRVYHKAHQKERSQAAKRYRAENPEAYTASKKKWQKNNPDKVNAISARYKASKKLRTPPWLSKEHLQEMENVYSHAKECEMLTGDSYHVDHIVPLQGKDVCGLHVPWNLQVLPSDVNQSKSNKYAT